MADDIRQAMTTTTNVAEKGLQDSMTGMDLAPPAGLAAADADVQTAVARLNEILQAQPNVDYGQKYLDLQKEIETRPTSENPLSTPGGALSSFAFALGAPNTAPAAIQSKIVQSQREEQQKRNDLFELKSKIVEGTIQQELAQGNFKGALKQFEILDQLERAKADRKRILDLEDWKVKQRIKTADATTLLKKKVEQTIANFHLPEKLKLKVMDAATRLLIERMRQRDLLGQAVEDIPSEALINEIMPDIEEMARSMGASIPERKEETPPAATTPPPVAEKPSAARAILEEIRKGKK